MYSLRLQHLFFYRGLLKLMAARVVPPINLCLYYNPICMLKDNLLASVQLIVAMATTRRNHRRESKWCLSSTKISARSQERQDCFSRVVLLLPHTPLHLSYSISHFPTWRLWGLAPISQGLGQEGKPSSIMSRCSVLFLVPNCEWGKGPSFWKATTWGKLGAIRWMLPRLEAGRAVS